MIDNINSIKNWGMKVLDIRSEKLFREAEEDFHYNMQPDKAIEKLRHAIVLSPAFVKARLLLGDILLLEGSLGEAFETYKAAEKIDNSDAKVCAAIANSCFMLEDYEMALSYVEKGFECERAPFGSLYKTLFDLQSSILIKQKKYKEAEKTIEKARYKLVSSDLEDLKNEKLRLIKQKTEILNKIKKSKLKLVK